MLDPIIRDLEAGRDLSLDEAAALAGRLLSGEEGDDRIVALLRALSDKGESVDEIAGFATGLMASCRPVALDGPALDIVGTGGSGRVRFNVSTAAAFVVASLGVGVAKHGNRGSRRPNGSFDLLEALGFDLTAPPAALAARFARHRLVFLYARDHHPAMARVAAARKRLGRRSIFNLVGPLANPAAVGRQVLGVADLALGPTMAEALRRLGREKALVVCGAPGIDEISMAGPTRLWSLDGGRIEERALDPADLGLPTVDYDDLPGGDGPDNATILGRLLEGRPEGGLLDMVCLNAAAALVVADAAPDLATGHRRAREAIVSGTVGRFVESYPRSGS